MVSSLLVLVVSCGELSWEKSNLVGQNILFFGVGYEFAINKVLQNDIFLNFDCIVVVFWLKYHQQYLPQTSNGNTQKLTKMIEIHIALVWRRTAVRHINSLVNCEEFDEKIMSVFVQNFTTCLSYYDDIAQQPSSYIKYKITFKGLIFSFVIDK